LGIGPTALTKHRLPFAQPSRAATPGENPYGWVSARVIAPPSQRSVAARKCAGKSVHASRCPAAAGIAITPGGSSG
jgi:hypothetical protein